MFHFFREVFGRFFVLRGYRDGWLGAYLALSMAFFAIMVLTIFALSQKQFKSIESNKISINSKSSINKDKKDKKRTLVFYHNKNFYDQNLKVWRLENQDKPTDRYTLAVPTKMSVKELFEIKKFFQGLDLQVTEQNQQWNEALENISIK